MGESEEVSSVVRGGKGEQEIWPPQRRAAKATDRDPIREEGVGETGGAGTGRSGKRTDETELQKD